jgi:4-hydroxy-tetrahydrodipicolinate synthase
MTDKFKGTGVALITPFDKNERIDFDALGKLVDHVLDNGVDFLVALGTTAETATLTEDEKKDILTFIIEKNNFRVPLICGMGSNNTVEVLRQIKSYPVDKVDGIMSVTPYYNKPSQEGLFRHFKAIANITDKPIILYNVPGRTGVNLLPETVVRLASECNNIIGIKEASGNILQCMELLRTKHPDFTVLSGDDLLALPQIALGMEGAISVSANCFTKDFVNLVNLSLVGKTDKARKVHYKLLAGMELLYTEGSPAGVKCALNHMNICENVLRLPLVPVSNATATSIAKFLEQD